MSEVRLIVRDAVQDLSADRHGSFAEAVIAALSAEPETIAELELAIERFEAPRKNYGFFAGFSRGLDDQPWDAGVVIVDLAARLVVSENSYFSPSRDGWRAYHDGHALTDIGARYHLPDDWQFHTSALDWECLAERRRRARLADGPLDARAVLHGDALLEHLARECFAACETLALFAAADEAAGDDAERCGQIDVRRRADEVRDIHARWLTAARDDLRGRSPRDVLLAERSFIDWDLQDRSEQWSRMDRPPRPLAEESFAYRYAGCGTHEVVLYYELVRHLAWECSEAAIAFARSDAFDAATVGDFLAGEVPRLRAARDAWLDLPDEEDFHGRTPRSIIRNERRRMPEGMSGHEAIIDHDCPLCQMQAELPGPMFWHLDGYNMDDDFAFSFHRTLAEWEEEKREWAEFNRRFDAESQECKRLGVSYDDEQRELNVEGREHESAYARLFGIGATLAEVITAIKLPHAESELPPADRALIDGLSRAFGNLREVVQSADMATIEALIDPVLAAFQTTVADAAAQHPALEDKADRLRAQLDRFLAPPEPDERWREFDGGDVPF